MRLRVCTGEQEKQRQWHRKWCCVSRHRYRTGLWWQAETQWRLQQTLDSHESALCCGPGNQTAPWWEKLQISQWVAEAAFDHWRRLKDTTHPHTGTIKVICMEVAVKLKAVCLCALRSESRRHARAPDSALSFNKSFVFLSGILECLQAVRGVYCNAKQLELRSIELGPKQKRKTDETWVLY